MHRPSIIFAVALVVTIAGVSSEYIWTGTEWKWKNPESPGASSDSSGTASIIVDPGAPAVEAALETKINLYCIIFSFFDIRPTQPGKPPWKNF